jgi:hypothetical protein
MLPIIIAAAVVGLGLYAVSRPATPITPAKSYRVAPGGVGRIYGKPTRAIPSAFWIGPEVMIGCGWVAEGARFLPADMTVKAPRSTLEEALLEEQSAWPYVEQLFRDYNNSPVAAALLIQYTAHIGGIYEPGPTLSDPGCEPGLIEGDELLAGELGPRWAPVTAWGQDVLRRIQEYEFARL